MKRSRPLAGLVAAVIAVSSLCTPVAAQAQVRLPALGESVSGDFSVGDEKRLGEQIMREIRRDPDYLDDPQLLEYLQTIWQPLVQAARTRGEITPETESQFAWESFLVRDRSVNAFALPGGYVGVHLGLIAITSTRDELAGVLGHELSHVTQRHIARSMVNASRQSLVGLAAMILGAIAASRVGGGADATQAVIVGGQAAIAQGQLNFSRDMEREADRVGYGVLSTAGFSPAGMASMFEKLESASRLNDSGGYPYLRSHPLTSERIGDARSRASLAGAVKQSSPLVHALMQARARVLMDTRDVSLRRLQAAEGAAAALPSERLAALYASALASVQLRDWARADAAWQRADAMLRTSPQADAAAERQLQWLKLQSLTARGDGAGALAAAQALPEDGSRAGLLLRAQAAIAATGRGGSNDAAARAALRESVEALQTWVSLHRQDGTAWAQLAQSAEGAGLRLRAMRADAEARAAVGDFTGAIDRLRAAQRVSRDTAGSGDFIDASIIDARLRDLQAQRRELAAQMRGGGKEPGP